jgi:short-subunit dehydrogenase
MRYQTAVVTGSSRGLGRAIADALAGRGLNVLLVARDESAVRDAADAIAAVHGERVAWAVADLRAPEAIRRLAGQARERFGMVDVLVNNAGVGWYKPFLEWTEDEVVDSIAVNLTATMLCCRAFLPGMIASRRGLIVNVASDLSRRYLANMAPYVGAKFGTLGFSGSLLREVKEHGVKVCTLQPGLIDTTFGNRTERLDERVALRPEAIAAVVAQLLDQPEHVVIDELVLHPLHQDF